MAVNGVARAHLCEREALLGTLRAVGPDAPTLCPPWTASTVAAHLAVSEVGRGAVWAVALPVRRLLGARLTGAALARLQPFFQRTTSRAEEEGWESLLARLEAGPPALFRGETVARIRFLEDWIHHEDVRRANGFGPRPADGRMEEALVESMQAVMSMPELAVPRRQVEAVLPDGRTFRLSERTSVRVSGRPGEIALYLAGRSSVADVTVEGDPADVERLAAGLVF